MLSICVTTKNRQALFAQSVAALRAATKELPIPVELVVADWQSSDCSMLAWLPDACGELTNTVVPMPAGPFSRGRGLNVAAAVAKFPILLFSDADMVFSAGVLWRAVLAATRHHAYFPICWSYSDQTHTTGRYRMGGKGVVALPRSLYLAAKRWDELAQWGCEDLRFFERVAQLAPIDRPMELQLKHQWHPTTILKGTPK